MGVVLHVFRVQYLVRCMMHKLKEHIQAEYRRLENTEPEEEYKILTIDTKHYFLFFIFLFYFIYYYYYYYYYF